MTADLLGLHLAAAHQNNQDNCPDHGDSDRSETTEAVGEESEHCFVYRRSREARLLIVAPQPEIIGFTEPTAQPKD